MTDAPDTWLLEQFSRNDSEEAFAALVQRHIALVHSVALRHTANPQHAEDITQAVFIILARKAGRLGRKTVLPGWLYHTARLTAANLQRAEVRRLRREQEAFMQSTLEEFPTDTLWRELSPQLDEAMAGLGASERDALVLRYFQNKSMAEVGQYLGLAENTAQKRVSRALEALRRVDIAYAYAGADGTAVRAFIAAGAKGIVSAGFAPGFAGPGDFEALKDAVAQGIVVVQSTRAGSGRTFRGKRLADAGFLIADNLIPQKARILLALALTITNDPEQIAQMFRTY